MHNLKIKVSIKKGLGGLGARSWEKGMEHTCAPAARAHTRKWFEKLHGFIERYEEAYREVSRLDCINLSVLGIGTEDTWRKCDSLLRYPDLNRCISALNSELSIGEQTISKDVLVDKGIRYEIRAGIPVVIPETVNQLKVVIKMLNDKIVRTQYLQRRGLSDYVDEI